MINSEILAMTYGLSSALIWGAADFSGGMASRRSHVYTVILVSQVIGVSFLFLLTVLFREPLPPVKDLFFGCMAGFGGLFGLMALYRGLAGGSMGIVAPLSAVVTALIPILLASFMEGLPKTTQIAGFFLALLAVWFLACTKDRLVVHRQELVLAFFSGLGFGLFFIFIDRASHEALVWPLLAARLTSIGMMTMFLMMRGGIQMPQAARLPVIALAGIFDTVGNAFFVLAAQAGRLDISAVLASLYPATTVMLAWLILKEKLVGRQWAGVIMALSALVLIAL